MRGRERREEDESDGKRFFLLAFFLLPSLFTFLFWKLQLCLATTPTQPPGCCAFFFLSFFRFCHFVVGSSHLATICVWCLLVLKTQHVCSPFIRVGPGKEEAAAGVAPSKDGRDTGCCSAQAATERLGGGVWQRTGLAIGRAAQNVFWEASPCHTELEASKGGRSVPSCH